MMNIGIDVMGGDYAPDAVIEGSVDSLGHISQDETLVLIGDEPTILRKLEDIKLLPPCSGSSILRKLLKWQIICKSFLKRGLEV
jgi:hypothetical protein